MIEISSTKNNFIKEIKKLTKKKYREEHGHYVIEGVHLIEEALKSPAMVTTIIMNNQGYELLPGLPMTSDAITYYLLSDEVFRNVSDVPAPQGMMALVKLNKEVLPETVTGNLLLLDNVQDPGNVGTMIRTADAAGYAGVVLGEGCADIYNPKVLRSMQGSHFHLTIMEGDLAEVIPALKTKGLQLIGTELNPEAVDYRELSLESHVALVMGNEGQGVSSQLLQLTDKNVYIPIIGQAESLNVAVAAGILMFSLQS
ncbi:RNA methyltransferase [uncultured Vagococcus sp.]|uniref:TrmH family RNA methyltransferase n=1 Tax=uncultured Vagococcus sp. TaxID=189676 RepID=UPI0028D02AF8|nr:RNA methyltransferase [uncultured Vagococcus sp.]